MAAADKNVSIFSGLRHPAVSPARQACARREGRGTTARADACSSVQQAEAAQILCIPRTLFAKPRAAFYPARLCAFLGRIFIRKSPDFWLYLASFVTLLLPIAFLINLRRKICRFVTIFAPLLSKNPASTRFRAPNSAKPPPNFAHLLHSRI